MKMSNKQAILLFAGVIVFLIIFAVILFIQQSQNTNQAQPSQTAITLHAPGNQEITQPSVTLVPPSSNAKEATLFFYHYYFDSPLNPLANGGYKNSPYLSDEFKQLLSQVNGDAEIFCPQNKSQNVTVGQEEQFYNGGSYLTQEVISRTSPNPKDLYRVSLENVGGKWLIFDINCVQ